MSSTPKVTAMQVIPVAGYDSMLLNLSGAHSPFFTRNIVIIKDNAGHTGVGEIPGGEKIRQTLEDAASLVIGKTVGEYKNILSLVRSTFADPRCQRARHPDLRSAHHYSCGDRH
ncbi:Glucarate dehydratase [Pantoea agglomerans]|uniref:Glucarate dehydratase n=1 Tax=Enterobacter agglomerans TaxID=549 RepID=A0A379ABP4_ENTAG|nr:Glucarate dehydratase [Pantoea agglomerans]